MEGLSVHFISSIGIEIEFKRKLPISHGKRRYERLLHSLSFFEA